MLTRSSSIFIASLLLTLAGCATPTSTYPTYSTAPTVAVSTATLSTMTETAAGDKLLDNSQVILSGSGLSQSTGAQMFGLFGALASIALDRANNAAMVSGVESKLAIKFAKDLDESLQRAESLPSINGKVRLQAVDMNADVVLLPYAVFSSQQPVAKAQLTFQVTARFTSAENKKQRKTYASLSNTEALDFAGGGESWTDNDNAKIKQESRIAFDRLSAVLLNDLLGKYKDSATSEKHTYTAWQTVPSGQVSRGVLLEEATSYQVVMMLAQDKPVPNYILVIDKALVRDLPQ